MVLNIMMKKFKRFANLIAIIPMLVVTVLLQVSAISVANAVDIQKFTTPKGIKVFLVENYTSPLITVSFSFGAGATQDPNGKEGVSRLLATMLDEGAGEYSSKEFQAKAEELGVDIGYSAGRDNFSGTMQTLAQNSQDAFELLRASLNAPRFDEQPLNRMRQAILMGLKRSQTNPRSIASKTLRNALFSDHPYARSNRGKSESLKNLTREDLVAIHRKLIVREGLVIGVVGAINAEQLAGKIDQVFASLPMRSSLNEISEAQLNFGATIRKQLDIPQSIISFALPGIKRADPDFFAAYITNHILGGGTFSSRLYGEVREKRGLAYSVYSHLATYSRGAFTIVGSATAHKRADETIKIMQAELTKMAEYGPTAQELELAKKYIIGSYAIRNLDTSIKVAGVLVAIQRFDLGIDYIDRREALISAVSLDDVKRVAAKLLGQKPTLVVVGQESS